MGELKAGGKVKATKFDSFGQLIYAETANHKVSYGYDHTGARVFKKVIDIQTGAEKTSLYPMKSIAIEPGDTQSYVFVGDQRLARVEHNKKSWYYYLKDHIGSSDIVMDKDNIPVEQMIYKPYGGEYKPEEQGSNGSKWVEHLKVNAKLVPHEKTHHRFTGQYLDDDTGLYYFGARYYDPGLGRFVTADPLYIREPEKCLTSPLECSLYNYARNNPVKYIDPNGTDSVQGGVEASLMAILGFRVEFGYAEATSNSGESSWGFYGTISGTYETDLGATFFGKGTYTPEAQKVSDLRGWGTSGGVGGSLEVAMIPAGGSAEYGRSDSGLDSLSAAGGLALTASPISFNVDRSYTATIGSEDIDSLVSGVKNIVSGIKSGFENIMSSVQSFSENSGNKPSSVNSSEFAGPEQNNNIDNKKENP